MITNAADSLIGIKNGQILISNSQWGQTYVQVMDRVTNKWGTHLVCVMLGENGGEIVTVHGVGKADMMGQGWKIMTEQETVSMLRWHVKVK
jgi:hypothetical protein